jgi:hypothetical protein
VANGHSSLSGVSENGAHVVFESDATNLDQGDTNGVTDIFVRAVFDDPETYCSSMVTADGCTPSISSLGLPSATAASGFDVIASNVPTNRNSMLFYGLSGRQEKAFLGGTLCILPPKKRTPLTNSGMSNPADPCSGSLTLDMNAFADGTAGGNPDPALSLVGQRVNAQFWGRDPANGPFHVFLSDAIEYVVGL